MVEWVKKNMVRRYGHVRMMLEEKLVNIFFYKSSALGESGRGRPPHILLGKGVVVNE